MKKYTMNKKVESLNGFVYFIINKDFDKVYVGETTDINRIENYNYLINNGKTKTRQIINKQLLFDIVENSCKFEIHYFETIDYKKFEKIYINYFMKNDYDLYNKILYKTSYKIEDIDMELIELLDIQSNGLKQHFRDNYDTEIGNRVYLAEGIWLDSNGDMHDDCY